MSGLPVLTICMSSFDEVNQSCHLQSRFSDNGPIDDVLSTLPDVGRLNLPFSLDTIPYIQRILNSIQSPNKSTEKKQLFNGDIEGKLMDLELLNHEGSIVPDVLVQVGKKIGDALVDHQELKEDLLSFYDAAREKGGDIVFNFHENALQLAAIPWELAYYEKRPLLLHPNGGDILLSCTRVIFDENQPSLHTRRSILHVLAVASYAGMDGEARALEQEARRKLKEALSGLQERLDFSDNTPLRGYVSLKELGGYLRYNEQIDILDYYGHGNLDNKGVATLLMHGDDSSEVKISTVQLMALQNLPPLIVFHVCHSAQIDITNVQNSLAPVLSSHDNIDAVVAMQGEIQMRLVADSITPAFYEALAKHESLPRAVARIRHRLFTQGSNAAWFVPVLYMRQFSQDPYFPVEPVVTPQNPFLEKRAFNDAKFFVGRKGQIRNIGKLLRTGSSLAITGQTGCGKTSILTYIEDQVNKDDMLKLGREVYVVRLPVEVEMKVTKAEEYIVGKIGIKGDKLEDLLHNKPLILLLDDLGVLDSGKKCAQFLIWLKNLLSLKVQLIMTNEESIKVFFARLSRNHALLAKQTTIVEIDLKPFIRSEARSFIIERLKGTPFNVNQFEECLQDSITPGEVEDVCWIKYEEMNQPPF